MYQELFDLLQEWDRKRVNFLKVIYDDYSSQKAFFENLVALTIEEEEVQVATTWLIKHHYDNKNNLSGGLVNQLLDNCDVLNDWEARLHILQLFPKFQFYNSNQPIVETFVREQLEDDKKFVRAAAYVAFFEITKSLSELKEELQERCEEAMEEESASVKVKLRRILKKLG